MLGRSGTNAPAPKVIAATGGAGIGYFLQVIIVWLLEEFAKWNIPTEVETALGGILVVLLGFISGYQAPATEIDRAVVNYSEDGPPDEGTI